MNRHSTAIAELQKVMTWWCVWKLRTTQPTGLILYSGNVDRDSAGTDFIAIELVDGRLRYVFDVGSGVRVIRDRLQRPLSDNRWHEVRLLPKWKRKQKSPEIWDDHDTGFDLCLLLIIILNFYQNVVSFIYL